MKKFYITVVFMIQCVSAQTNLVQVTGDRVSLRLSPSIDGELLNRAMEGEEFLALSASNGWQEVIAPEYISAWVSSSYISNNIVLANKLNVRTGPNKNYGILTVISKDDVIEDKEVFNDWVKIKPPENTSIWISKQYLRDVQPESIIEEKELLELQINLTQSISSINLDLDFSMEQNLEISYEGFLKPSYSGLYELLSINDEKICFIRGRKYQLEPLLNKRIYVRGKSYYIISSSFPVIQPDEIQVLDNDL